jgi:hypothetical protein
MRSIARTIGIILSAALLAGSAPASPTLAAPGENTVVRWNKIALDTIVTTPANSKSSPSLAILYVAITQAAVYDAVMAIEETHEPYAFAGEVLGRASVDAAVAAAAHDVLIEYFPDKAPGLDADLAESLAPIPDGPSEDRGVAVGQQAAATIIELRADDGRDAPAPPADAFDGTEPGEWRRTTIPGSPVTPQVANVTPFLAESPDQFRPDGPNELTSHAYAVEFERTRLYGARFGSLRSPEQTEIAQFWTENTVGQYNRALRGLAEERDLDEAEAARLFAMTDIPAADAMITCWDTKYHYLAWRPVTAINEAASDGNPATNADPNSKWLPLSTTANHPEYVSGHACLTGAITEGLHQFLGTKKIDLEITFENPPGTTVLTHHFPTVEDLRTEVEDARVYGGDHWTTGGTDGTTLGDELAKWALHRYFERR